MKADIAPSDPNSLSRELLAKIRRDVGSNFIARGSYLVSGDGRLRVNMTIQNADTSDITASVSDVGNEDDPGALVERSAEVLRTKLGLSEIKLTGSIRASLPSHPAAARFYSQGIDTMRLGDSSAAVRFLNQAADLEPSFALTHAALAEALADLGYDEKAKLEPESLWKPQ